MLSRLVLTGSPAGAEPRPACLRFALSGPADKTGKTSTA